MQVYLPIAEMSVNALLVLGMGWLVGFLSGMFGVGGGFLMTPLLIFIGVPPAIAVGTQANQLVAASVSGVLAHWRRGNVDVKLGVVMLGGGVVGTAVGVWIFGILQRLGQIDIAITLSYVFFLGTIGGMMLVESSRAILRRRAPTAKRGKLHRHIWLHGLPFYLAGVILSSLQYAERFIASRSLSADVLGQYVFAWSIASAAQAITFAVVVVTAAPRLIRTLADAPDTFLRRTTHAVTANIAVTLLASAIIFVAHPVLFALTNEPIAEKNVTLLALLLVSFILRAATDVLWVAAVALRAGGVVLATIAALTLLYIPAARYLIGNSGAVGMALAHLAASFAIAAALALIVMRRGGVWHVKHPTEIASHAG